MPRDSIAEVGTPTVWILTDRRYLGQRMPAALACALDGRRPIKLLIADETVNEVGSGLSARPAPGDVVVARTRDPFGLSILCQAEMDGADCLNSHTEVLAVKDKAHATMVLAERGIPTPRTFLTGDPRLLRDLPSTAWPMLLKPALGDNAQGIVRVDRPEELSGIAWPTGSVTVAQQYVDVDGVDLKLYGAGDAVWAVRRRSPLARGADIPRPLPVGPELRALAHACRDAFGLFLYGVDVLPSPEGPLVVDVNDFPNYTGVDEAPQTIADLVVAAAAQVSSCHW
ncbi:MAG: ATP-grasp domain-containing protein [Actinokineospora sp.]